MTAIAAAICSDGILIASDGKAQGRRLHKDKHFVTESASKMYPLSDFVWLLAFGGGPEDYPERLVEFIEKASQNDTLIDLAYCKAHLGDYLEKELGIDFELMNSRGGFIIAGYTLSDEKPTPEILWCHSTREFRLHPSDRPYKAAGTDNGKICEDCLEGLYKAKASDLPTFSETSILIKMAIEATAKVYPNEVNDNVTIKLLSPTGVKTTF